MADNTAPDFQYNLLVTPENSRPPLSYGSGGRSPGPPSVLRSTIVDFFKEKGVKDHVAEGIADALYTESGIRGTTLYNPLAVNPRSGATGLEQALGSRKAELQSQPDWTEPRVQLENMWREVTGGDKIATAHWGEIKNASDRPAAKQLWAQYFERGEGTQTARGSAPGWIPSDGAIESEQNKSNTDVKYITPEEYLSMLPPIKWDDSARAKRKNLQDSLASGDNIEAIPSLEVTPRGDNLVVADWDGRNRAQAAIDAGVDEIPVAIRGVPPGSEFKRLVGDKKVSLPYTFADVPRPAKPTPPIGAAEQARQIVPEAFAPGPRPPMVPPPGPPMVPPAPAPPLAPPSAKPDFYPEIAAGINKDVVNPAGYGYRGVGVPDLATNATASGRIAAANAGSAGQIGLGGAIGSALSALNPIGSAQAAEPSDTLERIAQPGQAAAAAGEPADTLERISPSPHGSYVPDVADVPGIGTVVPPVVNALGGFATSPAASLGALAATQRPGQPFNIGAWQQQYEKTLMDMSMPETPWGNFIHKYIIGAPGQVLSGLAQAGLTEQQVNTLAPYAELGMSLLGAGVFNPRIAGILSRPGAAVASRALRPVEVPAVNSINRAYRKEQRFGGAPASIVGSGFGGMAEAQASEVPLAPMDFRRRGGPIENLLGRSLQHSPEAAAGMEKFVLNRREGALSRMDAATEQALGTGSAQKIADDITAKLSIAQRDVANARLGHDRNGAQLKKRVDQLTGLGATPKNIALDPEVSRLVGFEKASAKRLADAKKAVAQLELNKAGLGWGRSIFKDSVTVENIEKFRKSANPDAMDHLRIGVADAAKLGYRKVASGQEPKTIMFPKFVKEKVEAAFDDKSRARDFMRSVEMHSRMEDSARNVLRDMGRDPMLSEHDRALGLRAARFATNTMTTLVLGHHILSPLYWFGRLGEVAMDIWHRKGMRGGPAKRIAVAQLLSDPNAAIDTTGRGLLAAPARSAANQARVNALAKASFPLGIYPTIAPQPDQAQP